MEQPSKDQTENELVHFVDCSKNSSIDIHNSGYHVTTTLNGDTTLLPLTTTTPLIEEGLVRLEQTNDVFLPLTSRVVWKRNQEMLYIPLDFENILTVDALVAWEGFVSAIAQNDLDTIEEKTTNSQNRRSSQFSDTSSQWPLRKTIFNSHT